MSKINYPTKYFFLIDEFEEINKAIENSLEMPNVGAEYIVRKIAFHKEETGDDYELVGVSDELKRNLED